MHPIPYNFYYDPIRQGLGTSVWNWFSSVPYQTGGYLVLMDGSGIMYYDVGRGCTSYTMNIPANPTNGAARSWGLKAGSDYIYFNFSGGTFQVMTSSVVGGLSTSVVIPWNAAWTSADTTFMIRQEAGIVSFYINGLVRAQISDASIPNGPMSPYVSSNGGDLFMIKSVVGQGLQSLILEPKEVSGDSGSPFIPLMSDKISLSETITSTTSMAALSGITELSTMSEGVFASGSEFASAVSDSITETETIHVSGIIFSALVSDTITETETISFIEKMYDASISDTIADTDTVNVLLPTLPVSVSDITLMFEQAISIGIH